MCGKANIIGGLCVCGLLTLSLIAILIVPAGADEPWRPETAKALGRALAILEPVESDERYAPLAGISGVRAIAAPASAGAGGSTLTGLTGVVCAAAGGNLYNKSYHLPDYSGIGKWKQMQTIQPQLHVFQQSPVTRASAFPAVNQMPDIGRSNPTAVIRNYELKMSAQYSQQAIVRLQREFASPQRIVWDVGSGYARDIAIKHTGTHFPKTGAMLGTAATMLNAGSLANNTLQYGGMSMQVISPALYIDTRTDKGWTGQGMATIGNSTLTWDRTMLTKGSMLVDTTALVFQDSSTFYSETITNSTKYSSPIDSSMFSRWAINSYEPGITTGTKQVIYRTSSSFTTPNYNASVFRSPVSKINLNWKMPPTRPMPSNIGRVNSSFKTK